MNRRKYIQPEITTVDFRLERGFGDGSIIAQGLGHNSLYDKVERFFDGNDFATGETFGGYTDATTGENATGIW